MEPTDFAKLFDQHPSAFKEAESLVDFLGKAPLKPGFREYLNAYAGKDKWADLYFRTCKNHGFVARPLMLPDARKAADIFANVALYPYQTGCYRDEVQYAREGAAFISANRAPDFAYFGRLGADYDWSPDWLKRGEKIRRVRGGSEWLTAAVPTPQVTQAVGKAGHGDWDLATFEATKRDDGRILIITRSTNGFGNSWLCLLNEGESAAAMLSEHERGKISAERERQRDAWGAAE